MFTASPMVIGLGGGGECPTSDSQGVTGVTKLPSEEVKAGKQLGIFLRD